MPELEDKFPEAFFKIGKDVDHTYKSLKTTRLANGRLLLEVEEWIDKEMGLYLWIEPGEILKLCIMMRCGTGRGGTWAKVSFSHIMGKKQEKKARQIEYSGSTPDDMGKISIH